MDIQLSLEGYKMQARIAGFRHRFAEHPARVEIDAGLHDASPRSKQDRSARETLEAARRAAGAAALATPK